MGIAKIRFFTFLKNVLNGKQCTFMLIMHFFIGATPLGFYLPGGRTYLRNKARFANAVHVIYILFWKRNQKAKQVVLKCNYSFTTPHIMNPKETALSQAVLAVLFLELSTV